MDKKNSNLEKRVFDIEKKFKTLKINVRKMKRKLVTKKKIWTK